LGHYSYLNLKLPFQKRPSYPIPQTGATGKAFTLAGCPIRMSPSGNATPSFQPNPPKTTEFATIVPFFSFPSEYLEIFGKIRWRKIGYPPN
jgi:hypothetical protein